MPIPPPFDTWYHHSMRKIMYAALCILAIVATVPMCEAQPLPLQPSVGDLVPTSPKEAWGDLGAIQAGEGSPWWSEVLLYIPNRILDLIDVFRVDVGVGASVGAVVRVTEYAQVGYRQMAPVSLRVGDFGRQFPVLVETSNEIGVSPAFKQSADREVCSAEIGLGGDLLIVGAYGGICLDELADFVGGLFLIDFKDDDM